MLLTLLEIPAEQHCPPPLPLRPTRLTITPAEVTSAQTISTTGAAVVVKDKVELLTTPKQIKRYEKYLVNRKKSCRKTLNCKLKGEIDSRRRKRLQTISQVIPDKLKRNRSLTWQSLLPLSQ